MCRADSLVYILTGAVWAETVLLVIQQCRFMFTPGYLVWYSVLSLVVGWRDDPDRKCDLGWVGMV
jgi:hypothetical protein